ncbi:hypothetical protein AJ79_02945 [Helicocarpus griseus UAMH5409]|uniref:Cytochrome P450 n=1 Tax=Helicocarpus griseus UAMH5409 TaxID=1447875 RepID=A0A2B7Y005_9EURO|nr:hypothetical protein AJ79_02945 [Helicocarpus griseus UAMH5409]
MDFTYLSEAALAILHTPNSSAHIIFALFVIYNTAKWVTSYQKTAEVPAVGNRGLPILSSWVAAYRFLKEPVRLVREGIASYNHGPFRISTIQGEYVLIPDKERVAEYIRAPDDVLSFQDGANDQQQIPFTMGYGVGYRTYHVPVIRMNLTKTLKRHMPVMWEEMNSAFDDLIGSPNDYQPFAVYDIIAMTVARITSRVFVGTELCENEEFLKIAMDYAQAVVISAEMLRPFPDWMKWILVKAMPVTSYRRRATKFLSKIVQACLDGKLDENGNKPDNMVQWLVDAAPPVERNIPLIAERIMALNVASIHTTTMTFTGALYNLAAEPEQYIPALREEAIKHFQDGNINISKETLPKLYKIDSFLKEAGRYNNAGLMAMQRNAKKRFTFSNGTVIPVGAKIGAPTLILHRDEGSYENPDVFDGYRFSRQSEAADGPQAAAKNSMVSTSPTYHLFGHGKHACPGRFYAVDEMKLMLASMLLRYDMKLRPGTSPNQTYIATMAVPDTKLKVLLKRRDGS